MESVLDQFKLEYEELPKNPIRVGRTLNKMSNKNQPTTEVKASKPKYAKTRGEHFKDIVIAVLVVAVVAFITGVHYADSKNAQMESAVKAATTASAAPVKK